MLFVCCSGLIPLRLCSIKDLPDSDSMYSSETRPIDVADDNFYVGVAVVLLCKAYKNAIEIWRIDLKKRYIVYTDEPEIKADWLGELESCILEAHLQDGMHFCTRYSNRTVTALRSWLLTAIYQSFTQSITHSINQSITQSINHSLTQIRWQRYPRCLRAMLHSKWKRTTPKASNHTRWPNSKRASLGSKESQRPVECFSKKAQSCVLPSLARLYVVAHQW
jgi:hypothetical protein